MKQGDLVCRKSYGGDVIFRIQELKRDKAILKGIDYRLLADSPTSDLVPASGAEYQAMRSTHMKVEELIRGQRQRRALQSAPYFEIPGKVLHLDGDPTYLRKCMAIYGALNIPAEGYYLPETEMPDALYRLLPRSRPDILVITGHDGLLKSGREGGIYHLENYKNSLNFVRAVAVARQFERNRDALTIIAGACQSHFEALLKAGANFASSPARVLIHALDPLYIAAKASLTSIRETIDVAHVISGTYSGMEGLGGIETRGSHRRGLPKMSQPADA